MDKENQNSLLLTYLEWCDSVSLGYGGNWHEVEDLIDWGKNADWIIKQAGYILDENDEYILIAGKYNPQEDTEDKFSEVTKIPKTWIKTRKELVFSQATDEPLSEDIMTKTLYSALEQTKESIAKEKVLGDKPGNIRRELIKA